MLFNFTDLVDDRASSDIKAETHTGRQRFTANGVGILIAESNVAATDLARIENIDHPLTWAYKVLLCLSLDLLVNWEVRVYCKEDGHVDKRPMLKQS